MTLWRAAGRAGEPGALSLRRLKYNVLFDCARVESPQSKPAKLKYVTFPAGATRHADWILAFGDYLVFESRVTERPNLVFTPEDPAWLISSLQGGNPGTKLSDYIQAMQPVGKGGLARYKAVAISTLPDAPTAAGVRPGAARGASCGGRRRHGPGR